jgi:DNA-binding transcriptional ArsR family regulator
MSVNPNIVHVAALIGDSSRSAMLLSLLGGKALPASELARSARVTPQTASSHLAKMVEGGLLVHESYGRHKYYRLASNEVGYALEALHSIASHKPIRSLRESDQLMVLRYARTCYDHLAGQVGVALTDRLIELGFIQESGKDFVLTDEGRKQFEELGVELKESVKSRSSLCQTMLGLERKA